MPWEGPRWWTPISHHGGDLRASDGGGWLFTVRSSLTFARGGRILHSCKIESSNTQHRPAPSPHRRHTKHQPNVTTHDMANKPLGRARPVVAGPVLAGASSVGHRHANEGGPRTTAWGKRGGAEGKRSDAVYNATSERRIDHSACTHAGDAPRESLRELEPAPTSPVRRHPCRRSDVRQHPSIGGELDDVLVDDTDGAVSHLAAPAARLHSADRARRRSTA
jgi:hypothetical protein